MLKRSSDSTTKISKSSTSAGSGRTSNHEIKCSSEEEAVHNYEQVLEGNADAQKNSLPPKSGEYYYQDYKYVRPTQADFEHKQVQESKLFDKTKNIVKKENQEVIKDDEPFRDPSILVAGFGMRNVSSFQSLLKMSREERKKWELRKLWRDKQEEEMLERERETRERSEAVTARSDTTEVSTFTTGTGRSSSDFLTQTETVTKSSDMCDQKRHLEYLLGLEPEIEEGPELEELEEESENEFKFSSSKSIREAQKYLRVHRIFECFQFIIAHLLSANADNPIDFIVNLLNNCLLYRSGVGDPPLLYEKKHIAQLFNLMDRLQTGFIDFSQYKSGMKTLGICSYNDSPDINAEDLISKDTFIEEAYEAELTIFNGFLKRHPEKGRKKEKMIPAMFQSTSVSSVNPPYFIPSDLLKFRKQARMDELDQYYEA